MPTRHLVNVIHLANKTRTSSLLLALDAEKAFNRIHWDYLPQVLSGFGFTCQTFQAIIALYTSPSAQVYILGMLSTPLNITNGTRQACPLSPLIFYLLMKPMATYIRQHPNIKGFQVRGRMHTISLFEDNIILMLTDVTTSLASVHQALQMFIDRSYYKVNETKSYILGLGSSKVRHSISNRFLYTSKEKGISYLGITLTPKVSDLVKENYNHF